MRNRPPGETDADRLFAELMGGPLDTRRLHSFLEAHGHDTEALRGLLRRAVPVRLLELVGTTPQFSRDASVAAAVVQNVRSPPSLATRLVSGLYWRDLASVAGNLRLAAPVRLRAESVLLELAADLRLGEKITLARLATPPVCAVLVRDPDPRVLVPCLENPRLREAHVLAAVRSAHATRPFLEATGASRRWMEQYAVRLALVQQPATPLGVAIAQLSSLNPGDLRELGRDVRIAPLLQIAAERLAAGLTSPTNQGRSDT